MCRGVLMFRGCRRGASGSGCGDGWGHPIFHLAETRFSTLRRAHFPRCREAVFHPFLMPKSDTLRVAIPKHSESIFRFPHKRQIVCGCFSESVTNDADFGVKKGWIFKKNGSSLADVKEKSYLCSRTHGNGVVGRIRALSPQKSNRQAFFLTSFSFL